MKKGHPVLFRSKAETFAFIDTQHARYGVTRLCRRYGVTRAGFYAWRRRPVSAHAQQDRTLLTANTRLFMQHHGRYGSPRIHHLLRGEDWVVSRRRVARLMRAAGLRGKAVRGYRGKVGTHRFCEQHPNRVRTMAVQRRRPPRGLIFHSDRGSEYLAAPFRDYLAARGIQQSACVSGPGDNAHMESFFHSFKAEVVRGVTFRTEAVLRQTLRHYFRYYSHTRLHSALGFLSPVDYEALAA